MRCPYCESRDTERKHRDRGRYLWQCHSCGKMFYDRVKYRRLSEEQKRLIERRYAEGMGIRAIAREIGVHPQTVNYYLKNRVRGDKGEQNEGRGVVRVRRT